MLGFKDYPQSLVTFIQWVGRLNKKIFKSYQGLSLLRLVLTETELSLSTPISNYRGTNLHFHYTLIGYLSWRQTKCATVISLHYSFKRQNFIFTFKRV